MYHANRAKRLLQKYKRSTCPAKRPRAGATEHIVKLPIAPRLQKDLKDMLSCYHAIWSATIRDACYLFKNTNDSTVAQANNTLSYIRNWLEESACQTNHKAASIDGEPTHEIHLSKDFAEGLAPCAMTLVECMVENEVELWKSYVWQSIYWGVTRNKEECVENLISAMIHGLWLTKFAMSINASKPIREMRMLMLASQ